MMENEINSPLTNHCRLRDSFKICLNNDARSDHSWPIKHALASGTRKKSEKV